MSPRSAEATVSIPWMAAIRSAASSGISSAETTRSIGRRESSSEVSVASAVRAPTAIIVISVVPISRAATVEALRRGLRATFAAAIRAGRPPSSAATAPAAAASGRVTDTRTSRIPAKLRMPPAIASRIPSAAGPICARAEPPPRAATPATIATIPRIPWIPRPRRRTGGCGRRACSGATRVAARIGDSIAPRVIATPASRGSSTDRALAGAIIWPSSQPTAAARDSPAWTSR